MNPTPHLSHRPAAAADLAEIVGFPQNADELFFCYPKADWPLSIGQLAAAMAERRDSTVVLCQLLPMALRRPLRPRQPDGRTLGP